MIASEHCIIVFVYFCVCKYTLNLQLLVFVLLTLNFMNINFRPLGFYVLWSKEHAIVNKTVLKNMKVKSIIMKLLMVHILKEECKAMKTKEVT